MIDSFQQDILRSHINFWISIIFMGSIALGAGLLIWHTATHENPIANAMARELYLEDQSGVTL